MRNDEYWKVLNAQPVPDTGDPECKNYWQIRMLLTQISANIAFEPESADPESSEEKVQTLVPYVAKIISPVSMESRQARMQRMVHIKTKVLGQVRDDIAPDQWFAVIGLTGNVFLKHPYNTELYTKLKDCISNDRLIDFGDCAKKVKEQFYLHVFNSLTTVVMQDTMHSSDNMYIITITFS